MKTFEQFCLMEAAKVTGNFDPGDWPKHNNKYSLAVINDLLDGKQVVRADGKDPLTIDDFDKQKLIDIKDHIDTASNKDFNIAYKHQSDSKVIWSKILKRPYSKSNAAEKVPGGEAAVLVYVDMIANNHDVNDLASYKPSKRFHSDPKYIKDAVDVLSTDKSWQRSALATARHILEKLPQLKSYHIYYRDKDYDGIRALANKLGQFEGRYDRWNPADVFFAKNGAVPIKAPYNENIVDLNNYIGAQEDIIGISLKKGDNDAMHGSVGLGTMLKKLPQLKVAMKKYKTVSDSFATMYEQLKALQKSPIANLIKCTGADSEVFKKIVNHDTSDVKLKNGTLINSVPNVLQFVVSGSSDKDIFNDAIQLCYLWAASRTPTSCSHYKASASGCKLVDMKTSIDFKLDEIIIPLNGNSRVQFNVTVDGNQWSLIARAKQEAAFPQFVIEHGRARAAGAIPIKQVKL